MTGQYEHDDNLILPFEGIFADYFVEADVEYEGHEYWVHCKYNTVTVGEAVDVKLIEQQIDDNDRFAGGGWAEEETTAYLSLISGQSATVALTGLCCRQSEMSRSTRNIERARCQNMP